MTKTAAIYIRVSTERQAEAVSPQTQENDAADYCRRNGYKVIDTYRDIERYRVGTKTVEPSGTRGDRPQFKRMLQDARAGRFEVIVAWREDRLYRAYRPMLDVLDTIEAAKIDIELVKESFDKRLAPVKAWAAKMELDAKHDRVSMGVSGALAQGRLAHFTPPFGYCREDNRLVIDENEAKAVRLIFTLFAKGETLEAIRARLIESGARQRREGKNKRTWMRSYLYQVLSKEVYWEGEHTISWDDKTFRVPCPPLITPDIAAAAIKRRIDFKTYPAGNLKSPAIAAGLCFCAACNSRLNVLSRQTKKYSYYRCQATDRNSTPHNPDCCAAIAIGRLDKKIWHKVWDFISEPRRFNQAIEAKIAELESQEIDAAAELTRLANSLEAMAIERQKVVTWARKGIISEDDLSSQLLSLTGQENAIKRDMAELQILTGGQAERLRGLMDKFREQINDAAGLLNREPANEAEKELQTRYRCEIVATVVKRVDVLSDKSPLVHIEISGNALQNSITPDCRRWP